MKNTIYILLVLLMISGCSEDNEDIPSGIEGSYLTINGDTRELKNPNGDTELEIFKFFKIHKKNNWFSLNQDVKIIGVDIYDPNHVLISNFGNYNIPGAYVNVTFVLPLDFTHGDFTTMDIRVVPEGNQTFGEFLIQQELNWTSDSGHKISVKDEGNRYILTFNNVTFDNGKAKVSGRIIINKV